MTTNKPEVVAWYTPPTRGTLPVVALNDRSKRGEPLIRLSDYEALQDKCEHYKAALLEMTVRSVSDQWRRSATDKELDQYLSEGIAQTEEERDRYKAECQQLRKHLQSLIDQTTPLEPEPGNPRWSRRIQLDEVIAERDQLRSECEKLRKDAERYRWLRAAHTAHPINLTICSVTDWDLEPWSGDDPDAAIDAAMGTTK